MKAIKPRGDIHYGYYGESGVFKKHHLPADACKCGNMSVLECTYDDTPGYRDTNFRLSCPLTVPCVQYVEAGSGEVVSKEWNKQVSSRKRTYPKECLKGKFFHRFTVTHFDTYKTMKGRRFPYWFCTCICGTIKSVRHGDLKSGAVKSCGCLLRDFRENKLPELTRARNSKNPFEASKNLLISSYKNRAKKKGIKFHLFEAEFFHLTSQDCHYCGSEPKSCLRGKSKRNMNGYYIYNGLDRVDNSEGYTSTNVVTACEVCNKAKRDMTYEDFKNWIRRLICHQSS